MSFATEKVAFLIENAKRGGWKTPSARPAPPTHTHGEAGTSLIKDGEAIVAKPRESNRTLTSAGRQ